MSNEIKVGVGLHNRFDFQVRTLPKWYKLFPKKWWPFIRTQLDKITSEKNPRIWGTITKTAKAENIVLNQGITKIINALTSGFSGYVDGQWGIGGYVRMMGGNNFGGIGNGGACYNICFGGAIHLGSGNSTPIATQTALDSPIRKAYTTYVSSTVSADQLNSSITQRVTIDAGFGTGEQYSEVGLAGGSAGTNTNWTSFIAPSLSTRALIVDTNNSPITITKIDLDVITITSIVYLQITHNYGNNLKFIGTATSLTTGVNPLVHIIMGYQHANAAAYCPGPAPAKLGVGSNAIAPAQADSTGNYGVKTLLTNGYTTLNKIADTTNKTLTYVARVPSTVSGDIREFGITTGDTTVRGDSWDNSGSSISAYARFILPIGNNAPDYNNVYSGSSITKDSSNVVDVSFVLQFGSL